MKAARKRGAGAGKGEETRERILNAALDLFRRRGFDQTTMREIAAEAGMSLGSAYYYFESKEALVMAFYERASAEMHARLEAVFTHPAGFEERLRAIISIKFAYFAPNRRFLGALVRHAADPRDPLSPLSDKTRHIRDRDERHFARALAESRMAVPKDLAIHLPKLLWLYQMALILFWTYDRSAGQRRTERLLEESLGLLTTSLKLAALPFLRPLRKKVIALVLAAEGGESNA